MAGRAATVALGTLAGALLPFAVPSSATRGDQRRRRRDVRLPDPFTGLTTTYAYYDSQVRERLAGESGLASELPAEA